MYEAIAIVERESVGHYMGCLQQGDPWMHCMRYNDKAIQRVACFVCAQLRPTVTGYPGIDIEDEDSADGHPCHDLRWYSEKQLEELEMN